MTVSDGDLLKVVVTILCPETVVAQNVFWYQLLDPIPDSPSNSLIMTTLNQELDAMYSDLQTALNDEYEVEEFKVDRVEWNVDVWETVESLGVDDLSIVGSNANDAVPHGVAAVLTGDTLRPQTRARKFIPGFGENLFEDSTLEGTIITALAAFIVEWLSNRTIVGSAELQASVAGMSGASAGLIYALTQVAVNGIAGYQRRRKPGVGS